MITELTVSNYRSLGTELTLRTGPLTVLIGPNGSGKSNLLDVLTFVRDAVVQGLPARSPPRWHRQCSSMESRAPLQRQNLAWPYPTINGHPASFGFEITEDRGEEYRVKSEWAATSKRHITSSLV